MTSPPRLALAAAALLLFAATACGDDQPEQEPAPVLTGALPRATPSSSDHLDPDLRAAVQAATRDAADDGVELLITSGWRSRAHQQRLYDEAVEKYGSEEEARRYVSTPDTSAHVTGHAVDIGPTDADDWLNQHGAAYGLCQVFANEIWHFELATEPGTDCPPMLPDSSYRG